MSHPASKALISKTIFQQALIDSIKKLNPKIQIKNPVMFLVYIGAILSTVIVLSEIRNSEFSNFNLQISLWLWFTVLFANFT